MFQKLVGMATLDDARNPYGYIALAHYDSGLSRPVKQQELQQIVGAILSELPVLELTAMHMHALVKVGRAHIHMAVHMGNTETRMEIWLVVTKYRYRYRNDIFLTHSSRTSAGIKSPSCSQGWLRIFRSAYRQVGGARVSLWQAGRVGDRLVPLTNTSLESLCRLSSLRCGTCGTSLPLGAPRAAALCAPPSLGASASATRMPMTTALWHTR